MEDWGLFWQANVDWRLVVTTAVESGIFQYCMIVVRV